MIGVSCLAQWNGCYSSDIVFFPGYQRSPVISCVSHAPILFVLGDCTLQVKDWPRDNYGKFFTGDSYIILHTYKNPEEDVSFSPKKKWSDYVYVWCVCARIVMASGWATFVEFVRVGLCYVAGIWFNRKKCMVEYFPSRACLLGDDPGVLTLPSYRRQWAPGLRTKDTKRLRDSLMRSPSPALVWWRCCDSARRQYSCTLCSC